MEVGNPAINAGTAGRCNPVQNALTPCGLQEMPPAVAFAPTKKGDTPMRMLGLAIAASIGLFGGEPIYHAQESPKMIEEKTARKAGASGVELSAVVPGKTVAGNALNITMTIQNGRDEDVGYIDGAPASLELKLFDSRGVAVGLTRHGDWAMGREDILEGGRRVMIFVSPGKSSVETVNLARLFDLSVAGDYKVSLRRVLNENSNTKPRIVLEIKDLPFKMTEPTK